MSKDYFKNMEKDDIIAHLTLNYISNKYLPLNAVTKAENDYAIMMHSGLLNKDRFNMVNPNIYYCILLQSKHFSSYFVLYFENDEIKITEFVNFLDISYKLSDDDLEKSLFKTVEDCKKFLETRYNSIEALLPPLFKEKLKIEDDDIYELPRIFGSLHSMISSVLIDRCLFDTKPCEKHTDCTTVYMYVIDGKYIIHKRDDSFVRIETIGLMDWLSDPCNSRTIDTEYFFNSEKEAFANIYEKIEQNDSLRYIEQSLYVKAVTLDNSIIKNINTYRSTMGLSITFKKNGYRSVISFIFISKGDEPVKAVKVAHNEDCLSKLYESDVLPWYSIKSSEDSDMFIKKFYYSNYEEIHKLLIEETEEYDFVEIDNVFEIKY